MWHVALQTTIGLYKINANRIRTNQSLHEKATCAVFHSETIADVFKTTAGVRQGCLMTNALEYNQGTEAWVTE